MATVLAERQSTPYVFSLNKYSIHRLLSAGGILLWPYFVKMDLRFWDSGLCGHNCVSVIHANWLSERIGLQSKGEGDEIGFGGANVDNNCTLRLGLICNL